MHIMRHKAQELLQFIPPHRRINPLEIPLAYPGSHALKLQY